MRATTIAERSAAGASVLERESRAISARASAFICVTIGVEVRLELLDEAAPPVDADDRRPIDEQLLGRVDAAT